MVNEKSLDLEICLRLVVFLCKMKIGGFIKTSLIDFPPYVCCVVFTQGCNFRCYYCHNPELVYSKLFGPIVPMEEIFCYLLKRKNLIDGVVFCGGEPTIQSDLFEVIYKIKNMGFLIKLDTNGSNPEVLEKVLPFIDYVSFDIKAPLQEEKYKLVCRTKVDVSKIIESINILRNSNLQYEFRTTFDPTVMPEEWISEIQSFILPKEKYIKRYAKFDKIKFC